MPFRANARIYLISHMHLLPSLPQETAAGDGAGHNARVFDLAFSPATRDLLASGSDDGTAKVWRLRGAREQGGGAHGPGTGQSLWLPEARSCSTQASAPSWTARFHN